MYQYQRNTKAKTSELTQNEMRQKIHTAAGPVEGLVPMGAASKKEEGKLYALSASPRHELSNRLTDAVRKGEPLVGVEHDRVQYAVKCTRVDGGSVVLQADVARAFRIKQADQTILGVEQDGKGYRVEITPLHQALKQTKSRNEGNKGNKVGGKAPRKTRRAKK